MLPAKPEDYVGEVRVEAVLTNLADQTLANRGVIRPDEIRQLRVRVVVDTGESMLVLPEDMADALGLDQLDTTLVQYADDRTEERSVAEVVRVEVAGRSAEVRCVVGPSGSEPSLGQIVLEITDLLVDCSRQQLVSRPQSPYMPSYKLK